MLGIVGAFANGDVCGLCRICGSCSLTSSSLMYSTARVDYIETVIWLVYITCSIGDLIVWNGVVYQYQALLHATLVWSQEDFVPTHPRFCSARYAIKQMPWVRYEHRVFLILIYANDIVDRHLNIVIVTGLALPSPFLLRMVHRFRNCGSRFSRTRLDHELITIKIDVPSEDTVGE